ncbi:hypothetical protein [Sphingomonas sp. CCH5-D11]|uniref:hypothetical protein n=1 Tax=Sphingomonas sp. CCH5-D11 TaxID=1768786 RepID=UPI0012E3AE5D|nr:hypothetical protein [Sphingomonas sp. CCH5-D11]
MAGSAARVGAAVGAAVARGTGAGARVAAGAGVAIGVARGRGGSARGGGGGTTSGTAAVGVGVGVGVGGGSGIGWARGGVSGRLKFPTSGIVVGGTCALATPGTQSAAAPAAHRIFITPAMLIALLVRT